ncbi:MAG TPA: Wzz/FepE/Etk N-terminal domain-containing protein [Bacillota bacterium]
MEETISLKEIFEVIKKRWLLIVGLTVGAGIIAAVVSYFVFTPMYESSSQFIVNEEQKEPSVQYNEIQTNLDLIHTYNDIIKSPAILEEVVETMDLSYGVNTLSEKIEVMNEEASQVVTLKVTDPNPKHATNIANATVKIFQKEIPNIMNVDNVSILSEAETGENPKPVAPKPLLNIAIAIVLGGMIGVGLAFLLEYLDNTIRTEDELKKQLQLPVLGVISHIEETELRREEDSIRQKTFIQGGFKRDQK